MTDTSYAPDGGRNDEATLCWRNEKRLMVFAGRSNPELGVRIADVLGVRLGNVTLKTFANGENYARFQESVRGSDLFIVQSPCGKDTLNDHVIELLIMIQAAKLASARRITAVVPYFPYARQDKKSSAREPISARLMATLLEAAGCSRVLSMDLHQGQIQGFFQIPVDHMTAVPMLADYFAFKRFDAPVVAVSADAGGVKLAKRFQAHIPDCGLAVLTKQRTAHNEAEVLHFIGDVTGKVAIIIDDMIDTGGSIVGAIDTLYAHGARDVYAAATHGIFSPPARERLRASQVREVVVTDTIRIEPGPDDDKIKVLSIAGVLANVIRAVFTDDSVSDIFAGEHQLF
jgi:ribose-phosphate pyrophosphokinase